MDQPACFIISSSEGVPIAYSDDSIDIATAIHISRCISVVLATLQVNPEGEIFNVNIDRFLCRCQSVYVKGRFCLVILIESALTSNSDIYKDTNRNNNLGLYIISNWINGIFKTFFYHIISKLSEYSYQNVEKTTFSSLVDDDNQRFNCDSELFWGMICGEEAQDYVVDCLKIFKDSVAKLLIDIDGSKSFWFSPITSACPRSLVYLFNCSTGHRSRAGRIIYSSSNCKDSLEHVDSNTLDIIESEIGSLVDVYLTSSLYTDSSDLNKIPASDNKGSFPFNSNSVGPFAKANTSANKAEAFTRVFIFKSNNSNEVNRANLYKSSLDGFIIAITLISDFNQSSGTDFVEVVIFPSELIEEISSEGSDAEREILMNPFLMRKFELNGDIPNLHRNRENTYLAQSNFCSTLSVCSIHALKSDVINHVHMANYNMYRALTSDITNLVSQIHISGPSSLHTYNQDVSKAESPRLPSLLPSASRNKLKTEVESLVLEDVDDLSPKKDSVKGSPVVSFLALDKSNNGNSIAKTSTSSNDNEISRAQGRQILYSDEKFDDIIAWMSNSKLVEQALFGNEMLET